MTAGWDATSNAIVLDVAPRRRFCLASPQPAARGLLSLVSLLRAFLLNVIKRNQAEGPFSVALENGVSRRCPTSFCIHLYSAVRPDTPREPSDTVRTKVIHRCDTHRNSALRWQRFAPCCVATQRPAAGQRNATAVALRRFCGATQRTTQRRSGERGWATRTVNLRCVA